MLVFNEPPASSYGVLKRDSFGSEHEEIAEQVRRIGYAILDSGLSELELTALSLAFDETRKKYIGLWGEQYLRDLDELHTVRAPLIHGGAPFINLVFNKNLIGLLRLLISGKFQLNQQNGIVNPPGLPYNQAVWHRDLPYQHFLSSRPLAINALFCIDDFTTDNGATLVLPASHKSEKFPSDTFIKRNAVPVVAKAGQYVVIDCMLFHRGGLNTTNRERRAINHVFTIPYFKQQINICSSLSPNELNQEQQELLGFPFQEPSSVEHYLELRKSRESL